MVHFKVVGFEHIKLVVRRPQLVRLVLWWCGQSTLGVTSASLDGGVVVDDITIDGTEIDLSSGDLTVDVEGDIILDGNGSRYQIKR